MKQLPYSLLILIIVLFSVHESFAQYEYTLDWSTAENSQVTPYTLDCYGPWSHECQMVRLDSENNVIVSGSSNEKGNFDLLVAKYTNSGSLIWKQLIDIGIYSRDHLSAFAFDENDNIIISGAQRNSDRKSLIIKISAAGEILWQSFIFENYATSVPSDLVLDSSGGIYVTGTVVQDSTDMFVCKLDGGGNLVWEDIYIPTETGDCRGMTLRIVDDTMISYGLLNSGWDRIAVILKHSMEGNLLSSSETAYSIGGMRTYHIDAVGNSYIGFFGEFKIYKFDQFGTEQWVFEVPTNLPSNVTADEVKDIITDTQGNVYITGRHYGENYGDTLSYTNGDIHVCKISPDGNSIYSYRYENLGTHAFDGGNKLFLGNDNHLAIVGYSQKMYVATDYDYVAIVLDDSGQAIDTLRHTEPGGDSVGKSVVMDDDLNIYITGTANGSTLTQKYSFGPVGTNDIFEAESKFNIYPNPFVDELQIEAKNFYGSAEFVLYDSKGTVIYQKSLTNITTPLSIDAQAIPKGFYFYQISFEEYSESGKLMKH